LANPLSRETGKDEALTAQTWTIVIALFLAAVITMLFLFLRMPVFRWYCRRCKKIVSARRFKPGRCICGTTTLVAYFCKSCGSWDTTPTSSWHCAACASKDLSLGVEYNLGTGMWRTRNRNA
jgi:hypothetical protein